MESIKIGNKTSTWTPSNEYYNGWKKLRRLCKMDKYFLECLADPWIFNSVRKFQYDVQSGGIIEYDGCGNLLFINKKTLKLEEGDDCFRDGLNIWKIAEDEDHFGVPIKTIERIINHFSDDKRQLIGVLWYNK